jgi:hypothetical protein
VIELKKIKLLLVFCIVMLIVALQPVSALSAYPEQAALTPPPPESSFKIQPLAFSSKHKYLDYGRVFLKDNLNGTVRIGVNTEAKSDVAFIGATVYLQKWTGTEWIDVGKGTTLSGTNDWFYSGYVTKYAESQYYHRARVDHWISHDGVFETGQIITDYMLVK